MFCFHSLSKLPHRSLHIRETNIILVGNKIDTSKCYFDSRSSGHFSFRPIDEYCIGSTEEGDSVITRTVECSMCGWKYSEIFRCGEMAVVSWTLSRFISKVGGVSKKFQLWKCSPWNFSYFVSRNFFYNSSTSVVSKLAKRVQTTRNSRCGPPNLQTVVSQSWAGLEKNFQLAKCTEF